MDFFTIYLYAIIFILGTVIGSFLNVCIYRIPEGLSIVKPRSRCGTCGQTLTAVDMVPILSWVFLKGKCRTCGAKIAARYPMVEALEGLLFVAVFLKFGVTLMTPLMWLFVAFLTVVFFIDVDHRIIPNKLVIFGLIIGILPALFQWFSIYPLYYSQSFLEPFIGMVVPTALMFIIMLLSLVLFRTSAMGMGDVKVYLPIGIFLGWQLALMSIWFAFFLGGLFGLYWIFILRKSKTDMIPFAPFIVAGSLVSLLFGKYMYLLLLN